MLLAIRRLLGGAATLAEAQRSALAASIQKDVVEVWVGTSDHEVHRARLSLVASTASVAALQGTRAITVLVDVTISPAGAPTVVAPSSPKPLADLARAALGSLAPALLGGATP